MQLLNGVFPLRQQCRGEQVIGGAKDQPRAARVEDGVQDRVVHGPHGFARTDTRAEELKRRITQIP